MSCRRCCPTAHRSGASAWSAPKSAWVSPQAHSLRWKDSWRTHALRLSRKSSSDATDAGVLFGGGYTVHSTVSGERLLWSCKYSPQKPLCGRGTQPVCSRKLAGACLPDSVCHSVVGLASSLRQDLQTRDRRSLSSCDTWTNTCKAKSSAQAARG